MSPPLPELLRVDGQVALVTGASAGIGKATAKLLSAAGAAVCLVARDPAHLDAAVAEIEYAGGRAIAVAGDATDAGARESSVRRCVDELGRLDILVNNVGGGVPSTPLVDIDEDLVRSLTTLNLESALFYSQLAWRSWMSEHGGAIVNVSSLGGLRPKPGYGWYGVTKAGLNFLTQALALELAPKVRVNAVAPGVIVTGASTPEYRKMALSRPLQRLGEPEQIAATVLSLVAPAAAFTTGQVIAVDGGGMLLS
jgi:NAD(P)-dependent dehydrogenase (short-subunit alcohol dehydrogenase family)